jgi:trehalose 6-phosphate synthase/phosphatase
MSIAGTLVDGDGGGWGVDAKVLSWNTQSIEFHDAYRTVNSIFAETVFSLVKEGDIAWIHDYHLMLVPSLLRNLSAQQKAMEELSSKQPSTVYEQQQQLPPEESPSGKKKNDFKVIFFLHIPFPTSQIFRTLPASLELLESMVCADLVGFHAFDHARHFLNASKRMLGLRAHTRPGGMLLLSAQDREVIITMSHVSIETDHADALIAQPETLAAAEHLQSQYRGMRVIAGVDVCQRLSGVALKLTGFEKFALDFLNQVCLFAGILFLG